jgi:hypothetical protein
MVQLAGHDMLKANGIALIAASAPMHFIEDTPPRSSCARFSAPSPSSRRQPSSPSWLRRAGGSATGRCEGPPPIAQRLPAVVALAKKLRRYPVNGRRRSLREISAELAAAGHVTSRGTPYTATAINRMIA